jgi:hypothetical protein
MLKDIPFIIVFDRGYSSIEFARFLEKNSIKYLFRLSSNDYKKEKKLMTKRDESVKLMHTLPRLAKIKRNHPKVMEELKMKGYTNTRIISFGLLSDNEIVLMTNLSFEINSKKIEELYFKR